MPKQAEPGVAPRRIDLRPPRAAIVGDQWYLVDDGVDTETWVRGVELLQLPPPVKISAIAWRL